MSRKLKYNSRFTPCPVENGDELYPNGIFVFNITKMTEYIMHRRIPCEEVQVKEFSRGASTFKRLSATTAEFQLQRQQGMRETENQDEDLD